jgi:streptogramin lyase
MSRKSRERFARLRFLVAVLVFVLALATAGASGASNVAHPRAAAPAFLLQWGSKGTGNGQFDRPSFVAVDDDGFVYVADSGNHRIQKFDEDGVYVSQWGRYGSGDADFNFPRGIAVSLGTDADPAHYVYVVDSLHDRIQKFTPEGGFITKWGKPGSGSGEFLVPSGVAVGPSGNVYVVDWGHSRIQKFGPSGAFLTTWGSHGDGNGQFQSAQGIAVDSRERVYVTDSGYPSCIKVFSASGEFLDKWTSFAAGSDASFSAFGVGVDVGDNVYVTDISVWSRVMKFTSGGTALEQWSATVPGSTLGANPSGVAVNRTGEVYVTDTNNQCVQKYGRALLPPDHLAPVTKVKGADKKWHNTPVPLTLVATDNAGGAGVDYSEARLRDWLLPLWGRWVQGSPYVVPASVDHSDDGDRTVQYRSVDLAGNVEKEKQVTVFIDTRAPKVTAVLPATARHDKTAVIKFKVQEQLSPTLKVHAEVLDVRGIVHTATTKSLPRKPVNSWSFTCRLRPGRYTTRITVTDLAGNLCDLPGQGTLLVK